MARPPKLKVEDVAEALRASAGIYTGAAALLARKYRTCSPNTVKAYVERHKSLRQVIEEINETTLDLAETQLVKAIREGDMKSVFFFLRTKGKHRGYTERVETTGPDGGPIQNENRIDLTHLTAEERDALRPILERRAGTASGGAQRA